MKDLNMNNIYVEINGIYYPERLIEQKLIRSDFHSCYALDSVIEYIMSNKKELANKD